MRGLNHAYVHEATAETVGSACERLRADASGPITPLVLLAEGGCDVEAVVAGLRERSEAPFFGGVFPALVRGGSQVDRGALVLAFEGLDTLHLVTDIGEEAIVFSPALPESARGTAIVLVDGLAHGIGRLLQELYDHLGDTVTYWGGGAGYGSLARRPSVFCDRGLFPDSAVVAFAPQRASVGVRHGWTEVVGALVATRTRGSTIMELNWEPAFDVYRAALVGRGAPPFGPDEFASFAPRFPFGLRKEGAEHVVRDPITVDASGALVCVGDVPQNAALSILEGDPDQLIAAAKRAALDACGARRRARTNLVADCISRSLFLEARFAEELGAMLKAAESATDHVEQLGMLTLGEIASRGEGYLELFNKTAVVASLAADEEP
ncbi:MAG: FIST N-terminal domain-containing protein [Sandaracinaceae bacterium]